MASSNAKQTRGPDLEPHQVVLRPLVTEKSTHQTSRYRAYPFEVNPWATKDEIKAAIESLFNVQVEKVRTQNRPGTRSRRASICRGRRTSPSS